jgi:hypothetical protein
MAYDGQKQIELSLCVPCRVNARSRQPDRRSPADRHDTAGVDAVEQTWRHVPQQVSCVQIMQLVEMSIQLLKSGPAAGAQQQSPDRVKDELLSSVDRLGHRHGAIVRQPGVHGSPRSAECSEFLRSGDRGAAQAR